MANTDYLTATGITGPTTVDGIGNAFELSGYDIGAQIEGGVPVYQPLQVTIADSSSQGAEQLLAAAQNGTTLGTVTLDVVKDGARPITVEQITLSNAHVTEAQVAGGAATFSFDYSKITTTTEVQRPDGSLSPTTVTSTVADNGGYVAAPTTVTEPTAVPVNVDAELKIPGITGPSVNDATAGDFPVAGYEFSVGPGGHASPFVVNLASPAASAGVPNLEQALLNKTVFPDVTFSLSKPGARPLTFETVTLHGAVVSGYDDPGGNVTVAFDFASATIQTYTQRPDGSLVANPPITINGNLNCYRRGTRITTVGGNTRIEELQVGDLLVTASGEQRPVRWLGSRRVDSSHYAQPADVWPICIRAGAFADDLPVRDLWVSPGHCILIDGHLFQAGKLVNGATIFQAPQDRVEYWHVELDSHDIILAEGLAAESYLDTGNRANLTPGATVTEARPTLDPKHWSDTCVPLVTDGPLLERAKGTLLARAGALGYRITAESDVHLVADGRRIDPLRLSDERLAFLLPQGAESIEMRCNGFIAAHVDAASGDPRLLGVCVGRLQIDGTEIALDDDDALRAGWHSLERFPNGHVQRWSHERTPLPAGIRLVVVDIAGRSYCWEKPESSVVALYG
jgi:type VI protein secretion system component Hcp